VVLVAPRALAGGPFGKVEEARSAHPQSGLLRPFIVPRHRLIAGRTPQLIAPKSGGRPDLDEKEAAAMPSTEVTGHEHHCNIMLAGSTTLFASPSRTIIEARATPPQPSRV
jgi:hypothetical protein